MQLRRTSRRQIAPPVLAAAPVFLARSTPLHTQSNHASRVIMREAAQPMPANAAGNVRCRRAYSMPRFTCPRNFELNQHSDVGSGVIDSCRLGKFVSTAATPKLFQRGSVRRNPFHHSVRPSRRNGAGGARRAPLRVDCARDGRNGRLGDPAALRPAVVRKTNSLLLGRRNRLFVASSRRMGAPAAFRASRSRGGGRDRLAGLEALRRRRDAD